MAATQFPVLTAGTKSTAATLEKLACWYAAKGSDQSVASSTTLVDDVDLQFASLVANAVYKVDGLIIYGADSTNKIKFGFIAPAGATLTWVLLGTNGNVNPATSFVMDRQTITSTSYVLSGPGNTTFMTAHLRGLLRMSSTAGTFKLQFAQSTSGTNAAILKADTHITLQQVA